MAKKISVKDEDGDFHIYKGPEYQFQEKDDVCRIFRTGTDDEGTYTKKPIATFRNYKFVKETDDAAPSAVKGAPAGGADKYTQAALASRGRNESPDFGVLDQSRPISEVTMEPSRLHHEDVTGHVIPDNSMGFEHLVLAIDEKTVFEPVKKAPYPAVQNLAPTPPMYPEPPAEAEQPKLKDIIETFGLKKASDLFDLPKPDAAAKPAHPDLDGPAPDSADMEEVFASVAKKWKKDGVDGMNDKQYGEWMGRLNPAEIAALIAQHQSDVKAGMVRMADPADAPPDLPDAIDAARRAVQTANPAPLGRKPRKPRATAKEQAAAKEAAKPEPEAETAEEADMAKNYQTIAAAEQRQAQRRKKMCPACHDTGVVPDPSNPETSIMCPSC